MTICGPNQSLNANDVAQLMRNAGFPESAIQTGLAVSYGESGWQSGNCNLSDPNGGSFGLWQINGIHFASGGITKACAFDPQCATNYAYELWQGQGWNPWGAFTDGRYLQFMGSSIIANAAAGSSGSSLQTTTTGYPGQNVITNFGNWFLQLIGGTSGASQFASGINTIWNWISNPVRIIKMVVGVGLVLVAVAVLFLPEAEKAVTSVTAPVSRYYIPGKVKKGKGKRS